jgi:osmotically-inducible protein OsmY
MPGNRSDNSFFYKSYSVLKISNLVSSETSIMKTITALSLLVFSLFLSSCAGLLVGAAASGGVAVAQEGGISRAYSDSVIQAQINDLWFRSNVDSFLKLDLTVNQGRVLVTGVVQNPEERVEAVRLAWQPDGVKQVINEIQVANSAGFIGFARDAWITTRLRTALTIDRDVQSINYSIDTVQGVVYLIGAAQSQSELNRVIEQARTIPDVKRVVSYVKLVGRDVSEDFKPVADEAPVQANGNSGNYQPVPLMNEPAGAPAAIEVEPLQ